MGAQQPKKIARVTKAQIDIGTLKARIHLELMKDRKNNQVIKAEKELVGKIRSKSRNKMQEIMIAERVINGLKYAQVCNLLIGYANSLRTQANFISQNMLSPDKMTVFLPMIYGLIYAADHMGLSSLQEFKNLMKALNDPVYIQAHVSPQIINALSPKPSPEEMNVYMLQFSQRNQISLEQINMIGHKYTKEWKNIPSIPSIPSNGGSDNPYGGGGNFNPNNQGFNQNNQGFNPNNQGFNQNNQGFNPNNQGLNQNNQGFNPNNQKLAPNPYNQGFNPINQNLAPNPYNQGFNPYNQGNNQAPINQNNQGFNPNQGLNPNNQGFNPNTNTNTGNQGFNPNSSPIGQQGITQPNITTINPIKPIIPANLGPNFFVPANIEPKTNPNYTPINQDHRSSINSLNDIDYYPEIDAPSINKNIPLDPSFQQICQRLIKGL